MNGTRSEGKIDLIGFADASWGGESGYKSRTGYGFMVEDALVTWYSGTQRSIAQSSAEAEYYAAVSAANEALWLKQLLKDMGHKQGTVDIYEDNEACIALTKNPQDHKKTKHIQIKYHVVRDYVKQKLVNFKYCPTKDQLADMFTKGLSGSILRGILKRFGIHRQGESCEKLTPSTKVVRFIEKE